jgi:hypothetical protein
MLCKKAALAVEIAAAPKAMRKLQATWADAAFNNAREGISASRNRL